MKGMVQVYTGNGKGKTTAAMGLALRASGADLRVFIGQFAKGQEYSEIKALRKLGNIDVRQFGRHCFIVNEPEEEDIRLAVEGLEIARQAMVSGRYDVIILDEANIALFYNLFSTAELLAFIEEKPENVEIIITGRYAPQEIIDRADLVTEMCEIKHYYTQGLDARIGIES
ncbi:cob(I)yrinic acid a,c-diamide adenosyltransferase [bacterium]|nr:cob(I)yrinic acid a,c-diamide adenosyltransferase [bacterium]